METLLEFLKLPELITCANILTIISLIVVSIIWYKEINIRKTEILYDLEKFLEAKLLIIDSYIDELNDIDKQRNYRMYFERLDKLCRFIRKEEILSKEEWFNEYQPYMVKFLQKYDLNRYFYNCREEYYNIWYVLNKWDLFKWDLMPKIEHIENELKN